jgi:hypothetical protein
MRAPALHDKGQSVDLAVPVPGGAVDERMVARLEEAFGCAHTKGLMGTARAPRFRWSWWQSRWCAHGVRDSKEVPGRIVSSRSGPEPGYPRRVYFGRRSAGSRRPILRRSDLGKGCTGPAIVEGSEATSLAALGALTRLGSAGRIVITLER